MPAKSKPVVNKRRKFCPSCKYQMGHSEHYTVIKNAMTGNRKVHQGIKLLNGIWY